jgi:hypothetical protein
VTTLDLALLLAIDQRVNAGRERTITMGAVTSRNSYDSNIEVTMEGSTASVPCKVAGDVEAYEGDRVVLVKAGLWWVVIASLTKHWPSHVGVATVQNSGGNTTSASFNDVPDVADVTFVKRWDTTKVRVGISAGSYCTVTAVCEAAWGARFTALSTGTVTTYEIINTPYPAISSRITAVGWDFLAGLAPDTYTVRVMWRRKSGTGTVNTDSFESVALDVEEVSP